MVETKVAPRTKSLILFLFQFHHGIPQSQFGCFREEVRNQIGFHVSILKGSRVRTARPAGR